MKLAPLSFWTAALALVGLACSKSSPPALRTPAPRASTPAPAPSAKAEQVPYPTPAQGPAPVPLPAGQGTSVVHQRYLVVDQFGYRPEMAKVAVLVDPQQGWNAKDQYQPGPELQVRRWRDGSEAFRAAPRRWQQGKLDASSGDRGFWFDFSSLREPGLYYVYDPAQRSRSHPFRIAEDVYREVLVSAQRMFYFNRANFEKKAPHACVGKRCWLQRADNLGQGQDRQARSVDDPDNPSTERDLSGGWWDAGDTNKYVTFANDAVHQLLTAYEERSEVFTDDFSIPESGNGLPDLIDELSYEFDWLKKMQPADLGGGVLVKMGNIEYGDPVPEQSRLKRYYYPEPCSAAAIVAAGLFAHGALVFRRFDSLEAEARDLERRAVRAWQYYHEHDRSEACDDGRIKSGDADRSLAEQAQIAVVAAIYLFALTGEPRFNAHVVAQHQRTRPFQEDRWSVYDQSQGDALLFYAGLEAADQDTKQAIVERKRQLASSVEIYGFNPALDLYRAYMRPDSYHWGSNNARAAFGNTNYDLVQQRLVGAKLAESFVERAAGMLHSFHGVNPMQLVYLTNMYSYGAEACADEAYHTWFRDGHPEWDNARRGLGPAPGYVTGGPNQDYCRDQDPKQHACATSPVRQQPPGKAYLDANTSYEPQNPFDKTWELTEPAIYYQASYLRLVSKFVGHR